MIHVLCTYLYVIEFSFQYLKLINVVANNNTVCIVKYENEDPVILYLHIDDSAEGQKRVER
jgi:hypothetical protein